ncbi:glycosyltransferase [Lentisphaera profundi]|uniref:Glycosyltransferase n=1 Tax=Lentisphaera profundi TaxID=1658616 RepID=A0ABY7VY11_9BACT|nr:glycosyltransferase [Lentisphaera profundi]WDE99123.1 glycosyltransferase [Lentisphaera profundi]
MKILLLVQEQQRSIFDTWYDAIAAKTEKCDIIRVSSQEQKRLKKFIVKSKVDFTQYDRVILFLRYKKMMRQVSFIQSIPNLAIIELDAYQNYCESKYNGRFTSYFKQLPWARILCTGKSHTQSLCEEGFDACFIGKAYDHKILKNLHSKRDIELAFLGSLQAGVYKYRREFLEELAKKEPILIKRTDSGQEYLEMLNRIKFFISPDIPFKEYMIKNFEAMACGCVLFTWNNGEIENKELGFIDMENVVLYTSIDELQTKLNLLRKNDDLSMNIAANGQKLVEAHHTWEHSADKIIEQLQAPLRKRVSESSFFGLSKHYKLDTP